MKTGWADIDGVTYYFEEKTDDVKKYFKGSMHTGWLALGNDKYYLDEEGARVNGWKDIDNGRYYFGTDAANSGKMFTGVHYIDGKYYGFDPTTGVTLSGLLSVNNKYYYFNTDGSALSGWQTIDDKLYYFYPEGYMAKSKTITRKTGNTFVKYIIDEDGVATILE